MLLFNRILIKRPVLIAVLVSVIGVIGWPIAFHHTAELNPFHSHLFLTPLLKAHSHAFQVSHGHAASASVVGRSLESHDKPDGNPAIAVHDYDSVASALAIIVSGWLFAGHSALLSPQPVFSVHALGPNPPSPQGFVSVPERPPSHRA